MKRSYKSMRALLALPLTVSLIASAQAAEKQSPAFEKCMETATTTVDMVNCTNNETKLQDARLNKAYKSLSANLPAQRKSELLNAQRAWLKYRDANCNYIATLTGGTMDLVNGNSCFMEMTTERAVQLEWFAESENLE